MFYVPGIGYIIADSYYRSNDPTNCFKVLKEKATNEKQTQTKYTYTYTIIYSVSQKNPP